MKQEYQELLKRLNACVWDAAELRFHETKSAEAIEAVLREQGFQVETGLAGMKTAFRATAGRGKPVIGFLAEFDALSGLSQKAGEASPSPRPETANGHGCGHSLLGCGAVGAALLLRDYLKESGKSGTVVLIGCPAEEGGSGKAYLARAGVFDELDAALTWHPAGGYAVLSGSMQANCQIYLRFKGVSSHAAAAPQLGRSALDAIELTDVGINYLREHIEPTDRIHYAILDTGGTSPNVVQSHAEGVYLIRSVDNEKVQKLYERVCKIAKGMAMATETEVEILFDKACSNILPNTELEKVLDQSMHEIPLPSFTEEETAFARKIKPLISDTNVLAEMSMQGWPDFEKQEYAARLKAEPVADFILPYHHSEACIAGSSDVGDCSHVVPTAQVLGACFVPGTPLHSWLAVAQGKEPTALKAMYYVADVLARAAEHLIGEPDRLLAAKEEFRKRTGGKPYVCPIPPEVEPNSIEKQNK